MHTQRPDGDHVRGRETFGRQGTNVQRVIAQAVRDRALRRTIELERSLLDHDAEVLPPNRFVRTVARDGTAVTGRLFNQDTFSVQLIDSQERLISLNKSNLRVEVSGPAGVMIVTHTGLRFVPEP
jgi:hypothetical protein